VDPIASVEGFIEPPLAPGMMTTHDLTGIIVIPFKIVFVIVFLIQNISYVNGIVNRILRIEVKLGNISFKMRPCLLKSDNISLIYYILNATV